MASLKADQKASFSVTGADEMGNPVPLTGTPAFTVDDLGVLTLTDNGDGTGTVAATGALGTAVLTATGTEGGVEYTGSLAIDVVAGDVQAIEISLGTPEEVTPDDAPATPAEPTP